MEQMAEVQEGPSVPRTLAGGWILEALDQLEEEIALLEAELAEARELLAHSDTDPRQIRPGDYLKYKDGRTKTVSAIQYTTAGFPWCAWSGERLPPPMRQFYGGPDEAEAAADREAAEAALTETITRPWYTKEQIATATRKYGEAVASLKRGRSNAASN